MQYSFLKYFSFLALFLLSLALSACDSVNANSKLHENLKVNSTSEPPNVERVKDVGPFGIKNAVVLDANTWLVVDYKENLWKTEDNGQHWRKVIASSKWTGKASFVNPSVGFIVAKDHLLKTTNGGNDWFEIKDISDDVKDTFFLTDNLGWLVGSSDSSGLGYTGKIWSTKNGGLSWKESRIKGNETISKALGNWDLRGIYFLNERVGFAAGKGVLLYSNDGGENWGYEPKLFGDFQNVMFVNSQIGWITERSLSASLLTTNGGKTWNKINFPKVNNGSSVFFSKENIGTVFDSYGYIWSSYLAHLVWKDVDVRSQKWNAMVDDGSTGDTFIGKTFDGKLVCIWLSSDEAFVESVVSGDGGKSWLSNE